MSSTGSGCLLTPGLVNTHHHLYQWATRGHAVDAHAVRVADRALPGLGRARRGGRARGGGRRARPAGPDRVHDQHRPPLRLPARRRRPARRRDRRRRAAVGLRFHPTPRLDGPRSVAGRPAAGLGRRGPRRDPRRDRGRDRPLPRPVAGLDGAGRGRAVLAVLRHRRADDRGGRAGPPPRRPAAHPPRRDRRRGGVLPRAVRLRRRSSTSSPSAGSATTCGSPTPSTLDDGDVARLGATGTGVAHCPSTNARLGAGIARTRDLRDAGVPVGLGVDGAASNEAGSLVEEVRHAVLFARARGGPTALTVRDGLEMATLGGAAVLGRADEIGSHRARQARRPRAVAARHPGARRHRRPGRRARARAAAAAGAAAGRRPGRSSRTTGCVTVDEDALAPGRRDGRPHPAGEGRVMTSARLSAAASAPTTVRRGRRRRRRARRGPTGRSRSPASSRTAATSGWTTCCGASRCAARTRTRASGRSTSARRSPSRVCSPCSPPTTSRASNVSGWSSPTSRCSPTTWCATRASRSRWSPPTTPRPRGGPRPDRRRLRGARAGHRRPRRARPRHGSPSGSAPGGPAGRRAQPGGRAAAPEGNLVRHLKIRKGDAEAAAPAATSSCRATTRSACRTRPSSGRSPGSPCPPRTAASTCTWRRSGCTSTSGRSAAPLGLAAREGAAARWPGSAARSAAARTCRCTCTPACSRCAPASR